MNYSIISLHSEQKTFCTFVKQSMRFRPQVKMTMQEHVFIPATLY